MLRRDPMTPYSNTLENWRQEVQRAARRTLPFYQNPLPPRWLVRNHTTLTTNSALTLDDAHSSVRVVFPDGRTLHLRALPSGITVTRGFTIPPGWTEEKITPILDHIKTWKPRHTPWSMLEPVRSAHAKLAQRSATTTHTTTIVITSMSGSCAIQHPLWTACLHWIRGGMITIFYDTPKPPQPETMGDMLGWTWEEHNHTTLLCGFAKARPVATALWEQLWPFLPFWWSWRHRSTPKLWVEGGTITADHA